ncbi:MAG TPA: hypothetical protein VI248_19835 [Kineosporiaceae bacterium]
MAEVVAWCFHSPRRLLLVVAGLLVALIGTGAVVRTVGPQAGQSRSGGGASAAVVGAQPAIDAAVTFTRAWASKPPSVTAAQWRQGLQPLVTAELGRLLAETDPASLPGGAPTGTPTVRFQSLYSAMIQVPLSNDRSVLVTVVLVSGRWLASDVEPDAGNVGAGVPGAPAG